MGSRISDGSVDSDEVDSATTVGRGMLLVFSTDDVDNDDVDDDDDDGDVDDADDDGAGLGDDDDDDDDKVEVEIEEEPSVVDGEDAATSSDILIWEIISATMGILVTSADCDLGSKVFRGTSVMS